MSSHVHPVVAGDVLDAVGELLPEGEQLLEIAEAAGHRIAPRIDDLGIRQDQMNQSEVPEIIRHLVDEARLAGAVHPRVARDTLRRIA